MTHWLLEFSQAEMAIKGEWKVKKPYFLKELTIESEIYLLTQDYGVISHTSLLIRLSIGL